MLLPANTLSATLIALLIGLTSGCGRAPLAATPPRLASALQSMQTTTLAALAAHGEDAVWEGRHIALRATIAHFTYAHGYGRTHYGYQLVAGSEGLRCGNIYAVSDASQRDDSRDFQALATARLLATPVQVTGIFHVGRDLASHSGVVHLPASIDVTTIDGTPLQALLKG